MSEINKVTAWSFSRLSNFERCPYSVFLSSVQKEPGPEKDPNKEAANDRGSRIHESAEDFVQGKTKTLAKELKKVEKDLNMYRDMYEEGIVEVEGDWGFTQDWETCGYYDDNVWLRVKCDVVIRHDAETATVVDYKTGKSFGNEVKHISQGQLYAIATFMRYPELQRIDVEFLYTDEGKSKRKSYTRDKIIKPLEKFNKRGLAVTTCISFQPKPNVHNCRWCDYGPNKGTGVCTYGVEP